jgi:hypothetical protein
VSTEDGLPDVPPPPVKPVPLNTGRKMSEGLGDRMTGRERERAERLSRGKGAHGRRMSVDEALAAIDAENVARARRILGG